jgi:hypothetical protein
VWPRSCWVWLANERKRENNGGVAKADASTPCRGTCPARPSAR